MELSQAELARFDAVVIGSGFAGAVAARELAESGRRVLVLERRGHTGGNCHDCPNHEGMLVHPYGPHIFHTNSERVFAYLSKHTSWRPYQHEVVAEVHGKRMPIPFNLNSLRMVLDEGAFEATKLKLLNAYGEGNKVSIRVLKREADKDLASLGDYIYDNVYRVYSKKQWGFAPETLDPEVLDRVPVRLSWDNRYFTDTYQGMPERGYARLFESLLAHEHIKIITECDAVARFGLAGGKIAVGGIPLKPSAIAVYTGSLDALFDNRFGILPYRTIRLAFETHDLPFYQEKGTVNYTVTEEFTRITEFKRLTGQAAKGTVIAKEYAADASGAAGEILAYPVLSEKNKALHARYQALAGEIRGLYTIGRLAEYRYYDMDAAVLAALRLCDAIVEHDS